MINGLRVGTQAQVIPTFTSTADHISEREAFQGKPALCPKMAEGSSDAPVGTMLMACWR